MPRKSKKGEDPNRGAGRRGGEGRRGKITALSFGDKKDYNTLRSRVVSNPATEQSPMLLNFRNGTRTGVAGMVVS